MKPKGCRKVSEGIVLVAHMCGFEFQFSDSPPSKYTWWPVCNLHAQEVETWNAKAAWLPMPADRQAPISMHKMEKKEELILRDFRPPYLV